MKKYLALLLAVVMALSLTACGLSSEKKEAAPAPAAEEKKEEAPAPAAEKKEEAPAPAASEDPKLTFVYAEVNPLEGSIVGAMALKFKEEVEARTNGTVTIDIQAGGVLGSENDVLDTILGGAGTIDMSRISAFALTPYGGEKSMLLSLPYVFAGREHFWNFATSDLAQEFLMEPQQKGSGIRGLFYGEEGFRHFFTKDPITDINGLKGMKLRVSNDPVMNGLVEGLGASPTVVSFGELYSALQTGVVDGAEQPIANYKSNAFPEVANTMILDGHTLGAVQVIITDEAWNKMSENQQKAMMEAGEIASKYCREVSEDKENEVLDQLKAEGCNIIDVTDYTPWQNAVAKVIDEQVNTPELKELYDKIVAMK